MKRADPFPATPRILPIFLPYLGCRQRCIFCNEKIATGLSTAEISEETVQKTMVLYFAHFKPDDRPVQIAFYGGTFTGMAEEKQLRLLQMVRPFLRNGQVDGIRISTRPDEIDENRLDLLRSHGVKTVEIGAQSLVEEVLHRSRRGHTVEDVFSAVERLRRKGFEVGLHLMAGLPGDTPQSFVSTIERTIALQPDTVRLHPTLVFRDTVLESLYAEGRYSPLSLSEAVQLSRYALLRLEKAGIPVIRIGLQTTPEMEAPGNVVAGPFHPAFRSLVDAAIFREMASALLSAISPEGRTVTFLISPRDLSDFRGQKNENLDFLTERFRPEAIRLDGRPDYPRGWLTLQNGGRTVSMHRTGLHPVLS
ncbi:Radical_SAM C-terminal domain-containing protein [Syntrophus gentianae]|uniref:Radical_SAM C-terminal domain-containing protein n=1 Tax=Syntrophus gentianae TaxID=43775 RepID=A0A1H7YB89_9BACT|nr:radical SAM protein [Syntrophus gentianae]SEM43134.1 Radical_SAM C-terminal domain-containing protein [Syntrophus gentianae]